MKKFSVFLCIVFLVFILSGCGRKGPLEKPVPRVPQMVSNFEARQLGNRIYFNWTNPETDEKGDALEVAKAEIRVMALEKHSGEQKGNEKKDKSDFLRYSRPAETVFPDRLTLSLNWAILDLDLGKTVGRKYAFGVRVKARGGSWSPFSSLVEIEVSPVTEPPRNLTAEMEGQQVRLSWKAPERMADGTTLTEEAFYNIYRSENGEFKKLNDLPFNQTFYEDSRVKVGATYRYLVRALLPPNFTAESSDSEVVTFTAVDKTPPARPEGLQAFFGPEGVALIWLPNQENDLAGYRVYRAKEGEKEILLTSELLERANYVDSSVEKNCIYEYSITAVDKSQNESAAAKIKVKT